MKTQMIVTPTNSNTAINTNQNILDNFITSTIKPKVKVVAKNVQVSFKYNKELKTEIKELLKNKNSKGKELYTIDIKLAELFIKNENDIVWNALTDQDKYEYRFAMKNFDDVKAIVKSKNNKLWNLGAIRKHIQKQRKASQPTIEPIQDDEIENDEPIANSDISFSFSQFVINFFATVKKYDVSKTLLISFRDELTKYIDSIK